MKSPSTFLLLLVTLTAKGYPGDEQCQNRILINSTIPSGLSFNITSLSEDITRNINKENFARIARGIFDNKEILGLAVHSENTHSLALNILNRLKIFENITQDTNVYWKFLNTTKTTWDRPFLECELLRTWVYAYFFKSGNVKIGVFIEIKLDRCDKRQDEIFNGSHKCDEETMHVSTKFLITNNFMKS